MNTDPRRILCIGEDLETVQIRCEVLAVSGFNAQATTTHGALERLGTETFDLLVLSLSQSHPDRDKIYQAAGSTPILDLLGLTYPLELLRKVEVSLPSLRQT